MASTPQSNDTAVSDLSALTLPEIEVVPFQLITAHDRKTNRLLVNSPNQEALKSRNSFFSFGFENPLFLFSVYVFVSDFADGSKFEYFWEGIDGRKHYGDASCVSNIVYIRISGMAKSIAFKPPKLYFSTPYVKRVDIHGFDISEAGDFIEFASNVDEIRDAAVKKINDDRAALEEERGKVNALQAQRGSITQDIQQLKSAVSREQGKLKRVETQRDEANSKFHELTRSISDEENRLRSTKAEVSRTASIRSHLAQRISDKSTELRELQSNIDLFPSELSDFSRQGAADSRTFLVLSVIPMILICCIFMLLVSGAADLTTKITGSEALNIPALAISRAPYVVIACTIITASYYLAKMLVLEMVRISRQRLSLTKISILAKDISASIDDGLDMSEEERYVRRLTLKMDMMKDNLKEFLSEDFSPTLPKNIAPSLASLKPSNWRKQDDASDGAAEA